ncbi:MAG TPA: hypothetical protein VII23_00945 [Terriglobales bacterium]
MAVRKAKSKSSDFASLVRLLPADVAAVVRNEPMDLSGVSVFCRRQAECAALFGSIVQINPGMFKLKSPYKESFIGSLHCFLWPNARFTPEETVANALVRHAMWYLKIRDVDALRERAGAEQIKPQALRGLAQWKEGIVTPSGEFTRDPEADGKPAILAWQGNTGDPSSFAIELCGPGLTLEGTGFLRTLQSMVDFLATELGLKRTSAGRPHLASQAEEAAYYRDHLKAGRKRILEKLCLCGQPRHTQKCFDRLNKLADSFYRTQRSAFDKLVREQTRKYPEINS